MVVFRKVPLLFLIRLNWRYLLFILSLGLGTWWLSEVLHVANPTALLPSMTVFGTVLSIFLAFRTNEAYNRWWEARTLWGAMVNSSRSWAREVLAYLNSDNTQLNGEELEKEKRSFVYRHLAYVNAVRIHLRQENSYSSEMAPFLSQEELNDSGSYKNVPTQLVKNQTTRLREIFRPEKLNGFEYVQLNNTLNAFYDIQGGCERIKNTVFPRLYAYYTTAFTWTFAIILVISLIDEFEWQTCVIRCLVGYVFLIVNKLGADLKNPFEGKMGDTPMTALCRSIEIDLRQMLGEKDLPNPIKSEQGVLM